ncbi:TonB-dependent receptor [Alteromonas aestuariivivens]|uniref:TonB-dependent receptor n=1 Tax=Alteromonas aestuariivivens TaxID=1938339 RepID=A0A3D8MCW1_9ALTE|nr:TonB-dependent receptor [Alteromonas aestuariivivens]RDV28221.1 TonB-dependent receptor [Alteromonas aestuariivivens]
MKFQAHLSAAVLALSIQIPNAFGQNTSSNSDNEFEILTVSGTRLPFDLQRMATSSSLLTRDDIRRSGARQISDLLRSMPGVSIAESGSPGSLSEIRLRGSESNHLVVLIDGVVANDIGQGSLADLAHLTTADIERVELIRGPQSAAWGSGAMGGVLNITTYSASATPMSAQVRIAGGNQGTYELGMNSSHRTKNFGARFHANLFSTDGDNISRGGNERDGYRNLTGGAGLDWHPNQQNALSASMRLVDYQNDYDGTDFITSGLPTDANNITDGQQLSAQLAWRISPMNSAYSSQLKWQYREDVNDNTTESSDAGGTTGRRYQWNWENRYQLTDWQTAGGLEYLRREFEQRGPIIFGDPNQQQSDTTLSAFGELGRSVTDSLLATVSARYDDNSEFDDAVSYRFGISWDASSAQQVFVSLGQAIKTPTFSERFGYFPDSFTGNPDLQPETSREWEIGARSKWQNYWSSQVSVYSARLEDEILGFVYSSELSGFTAQNALSDSHRKGLEAEISYQAAHFSFLATYSYLDASQESSETQQPELRRARHQGGLRLSGDLPGGNWSGYLNVAYTGSRLDTYYPPYPQPAQTVGLRPYTLVSANLSYQISDTWQMALRLDNALNADYEDIVGYQGKQRRAILTLQYQL